MYYGHWGGCHNHTFISDAVLPSSDKSELIDSVLVMGMGLQPFSYRLYTIKFGSDFVNEDEAGGLCKEFRRNGPDDIITKEKGLADVSVGSGISRRLGPRFHCSW